MLTNDPLTKLGDRVGKYSQTKHEVKDDKQFAVVGEGNGVFIADGGCRDYNRIQAVEPGGTFNPTNSYGPEDGKADNVFAAQFPVP